MYITDNIVRGVLCFCGNELLPHGKSLAPGNEKKNYRETVLCPLLGPVVM